LSFFSRPKGRRILIAAVAVVLAVLAARPASAQSPRRRLAQMDVSILGLSATVEPGAGFRIEGDLSGPALSRPIALPYTPAEEDDPNDPDDALPVAVGVTDPLTLLLPGLPVSGDYTLAKLRITSAGRPDFDVTPSRIPVRF
jgi:hypothetical protein